jgi:hypothetical protein
MLAGMSSDEDSSDDSMVDHVGLCGCVAAQINGATCVNREDGDSACRLCQNGRCACGCPLCSLHAGETRHGRCSCIKEGLFCDGWATKAVRPYCRQCSEEHCACRCENCKDGVTSDPGSDVSLPPQETTMEVEEVGDGHPPPPPPYGNADRRCQCIPSSWNRDRQCSRPVASPEDPRSTYCRRCSQKQCICSCVNCSTGNFSLQEIATGGCLCRTIQFGRETFGYRKANSWRMSGRVC